MLKKSIKALTPPLIWWGLKKLFVPPPPPPQMFDGHGTLFKELLKSSNQYGEYGCGMSTRWVLENTQANVRSVDTSKEWIESITLNLDPAQTQRLEIHHVDLGTCRDWGFPNSYEKRNLFPNYTNWIWEASIKPDTVLIDGRFRVASFLTSLKKADEGTRMLFDDYINRPRYHLVEHFIKKEDSCGRQALFIVPPKNNLDIEAIDIEIHNFRHVMY